MTDKKSKNNYSRKARATTTAHERHRRLIAKSENNGLRTPSFVGGVAELFQGAGGAFGFAGFADLAAVVDEFVGELDPAVLGDDFHQVLFDGLRGVAAGEAEAAGDAEDVGVYDDSFGFAVGYAEDDVSGFTGCSGDGQQLAMVCGTLLWNCSLMTRPAPWMDFVLLW